MIAGPNGSGKTTVTVSLRRDQWSEGVEYINPDDIAKEKFGDWNSRDAILSAANWAQNRREELLAQRAGIAFETVFSAPDKIRVFFVSTSDPRINASRVMQRVMDGGHTVPLEKIVSRYDKSMINLAAAIEIADRVYLYDNSIENAEANLCARVSDGMIRKIYGELPFWVEKAITRLTKHPKFEDARV
jgi:predicted ABC-type ATPase